MATHSTILAWKILWIEDPSELQIIELQIVAHDAVTNQPCNQSNNRMLFRTSTDSMVLLLTTTQHIYILSFFGIAYIHPTPTSPLSYYDELQTHKGSFILSNQNIMIIVFFSFFFFIKAPGI